MSDKIGLMTDMRYLINVIDELSDAGLERYMNLPKIVVIGSQSAGKSSILEAIVGYDFLPRGDGVVTRRPLELRLQHKRGQALIATFACDPNENYTDLNLVRLKIEEFTNLVAGSNKGIVNTPLVLNISGEDVPDLSLVDLPGITRVPLRGSDQNDDIEELTRSMSENYVSDPLTIILAVVPANQDISTSDALKIARSVDPKGVRTIGVVTKIDLMDKGTNALSILRGEEIYLQLGFVAVKNRSQKDINEQKSLKDAIQDELNFFSSHSDYKNLHKNFYGIKNLTERLTRILYCSIKENLPILQAEIAEKCKDITKRLGEIGTPLPVDISGRTKLLWFSIQMLCSILDNLIRGKFDPKYNKIVDQDLFNSCGGSKIRSIFNQLLDNSTVQNEVETLGTDEINSMLHIHDGNSLPGFPSIDCFQNLLSPFFENISLHTDSCFESISLLIETCLECLIGRIFVRIPRLGFETLTIAKKILEEHKSKTKTIIKQIVECETNYLFTNDLSYLSKYSAYLAESNSQLAKSTDASKANLDYAIEIKQRLVMYYGIVVRNIRDAVPKAIGHFLVRQIVDSLQFQLYNQLSYTISNAEMFEEPDELATERQNITMQLSTLNRCNDILAKNPTIVKYLAFQEMNRTPWATNCENSSFSTCDTTDMIRTTGSFNKATEKSPLNCQLSNESFDLKLEQNNAARKSRLQGLF